MQRGSKRRQGSAMVEFVLAAAFFFVPLIVGLVTMGFTLSRSLQVAQLTRDIGRMFVRGVDFSEQANQDMLTGSASRPALPALARGLGIERNVGTAEGGTSGNGVLVLSTLARLPNSCNCSNAGNMVLTRRIVVGNKNFPASPFGNPAPGLPGGPCSEDERWEGDMRKTLEANRMPRKGISLIATTLLLLTIMPLVGLGVDLTMLYLVKAKLLSASDAAVLAGARALVFTYQSRTDFNTPDASGDTISSLISGTSCHGDTSSAQALNAAHQEIQRVNNPGRVNVIVFMTDGRPNGVTADFVSHRSNPKCNPAAGPLVGVLAQWANNASSGDMAGLMQHTGTGVSSPNPEVYTPANSQGCYFRSDLKHVRKDLWRIPRADIYGNRLDGPYETPVNLKRVDLPREISQASANALDNQATSVRSDPNDPSLAQDPAPGPACYASQQNQPHGMYVEAPDATHLQAAFDTIATHMVVRLSR